MTSYNIYRLTAQAKGVEKPPLDWIHITKRSSCPKEAFGNAANGKIQSTFFALKK